MALLEGPPSCAFHVSTVGLLFMTLSGDILLSLESSISDCLFCPLNPKFKLPGNCHFKIKAQQLHSPAFPTCGLSLGQKDLFSLFSE